MRDKGPDSLRIRNPGEPEHHSLGIPRLARANAGASGEAGPDVEGEKAPTFKLAQAGPAPEGHCWILASAGGRFKRDSEIDLGARAAWHLNEHTAIADNFAKGPGGYLQRRLVLVAGAPGSPVCEPPLHRIWSRLSTSATLNNERGLTDQPKRERRPLEESDDARTLSVDLGARGCWCKSFAGAAAESTQRLDPGTPLGGVEMALRLCKVKARKVGDPRQWLDRWCRPRDAAQSERTYRELTVLTDALRCFATIDQVNVGGLVGVECLCSRAANIVEA